MVIAACAIVWNLITWWLGLLSEDDGDPNYKLRPFGGACAETGGAAAVFVASAMAIPVSTTQTITGAIVSVGAADRLSAVRWGIAGRIVWACVLTMPMSAFMAALGYVMLR